MVDKYYLRSEQHRELKEYCDSVGIDFCSTPFASEEVDLLNDLKVPYHKVASMDVNNLTLLRNIAQSGKPVLLSTGMSTLSEIEQAVKTIEDEGNGRIVLLHCISIYPPVYGDIHLRNIQMLQETFGYPVGFSDHTVGYSIPLASVALGSCLIEKHFTLDKNLPGWDHAISADPFEMKIIVEESKNVVLSLGNSKRVVSKAEEEKKLKFRRSIVVRRNLKKGHVLQVRDLDVKRPGTGINPDEMTYVLGRRLSRDVEGDELLLWDCLD
jgi:N-acetylneuraminate synthase